MITLYHNPKCSKSRETLAILQENGVNVQIIEHLNTPLDKATISKLISESDIAIEQALRTETDEYKTLIKGKNLSDEQIIELIVQYPKLLNRPFASGAKGTKFCRPPELVKELL